MFEKQLIIVGIDPGTTVGYSILDLDGNLIKVDSAKYLDLSSLISIIINYGKILAIGTDKQRIPSFVNDFAVKTGGIVISPKEDVKVEEKESLTKEFDFKGDHQKDALASAVLAHRRLKQLINKIYEFTKNNKKEHLKNKIIDLVIKNDGISIKSAAQLLEKKTETNKIIKKIIETKKLKQSDFFKLNERLRILEDENKLLRAQTNKQKNELTRLIQSKDKELNKISKDSIDRKLQEIIKQKEIRLNFFYDNVKTKDDEIKKLSEDNKKLLRFLAYMNEKILLKKLDNLGSIEFEKKKGILNIKDCDVLFVKDPNIMSNDVFQLIKDKIDIIVCQIRPSKKIKESFNFIFIEAEKLNIEEDYYFALVDKKELESIIEKSDILNKIVKEYKDSKA